jgi:transposase
MSGERSARRQGMAALLGVEKTVVEGVEFDEVEQVMIGKVRPAHGAARRCGICQRRCGRYDAAVRGRVVGGRWIWARCGRRWRPTHRGFPARLTGWWWRTCRGPGTARVTVAFDETVAWLAATQTSKSAVTELMLHRNQHGR